MNILVERLWGKQHGGWVPLITHLEDTVDTALWLWDNNWLQQEHKEAVQRWLGSDEPAARAAVAAVAGWHDLGKATPNFQMRTLRDSAAGIEREELLRPLADKQLINPTYTPSHINHEADGAAILAALLKHAGVPEQTAHAVAGLSSSERGRFPTPAQFELPHSPAPDTWPHIAQTLYAHVAHHAGTSPSVLAGVELPATSRERLSVYVALSATALLADWWASALRREQLPEAHSVPYNPADYQPLDFGRNANLSAYAYTWNTPDNPHQGDVAWHATTGDRLRDGQRAVLNAARGCGDGPPLFILEDMTGAGKTEASYLFIAEMLAQGKATGAYIALPTTATADAAHARFTQWLTRLGADVAVPVLHSRAGGLNQQNKARTRIDAFMGSSKRLAVLPRFSVGTVDQLLLLPQRQPFISLRAAGFANRVVVFDEAHAYDLYMSELFYESIKWLRDMNCPVLVMSATLPAYVKEKLLDVWNGRPRSEPTSSYPLLTVSHQQEPVTIPAVRDENLELVPYGSATPKELAELVRDKVTPEPRGQLAVVCNTVSTAIDVYEHTKELLGDHADVTLVHSRLLPADRSARERELLRTHDRSRLRVVIATQIIEQSLDLDFDHMITELCPADLLIQRAGRVHRHDQPDRPSWGTQRTLLVLGVNRDNSEGLFQKHSYVYVNGAPAALVRTNQELASCLATSTHMRIGSAQDGADFVGRVYAQTRTNEWWDERQRNLEQDHTYQAHRRLVDLEQPLAPADLGVGVEEDGRVDLLTAATPKAASRLGKTYTAVLSPALLPEQLRDELVDDEARSVPVTDSIARKMLEREGNSPGRYGTVTVTRGWRYDTELGLVEGVKE